jgi:hypothetical protein
VIRAIHCLKREDVGRRTVKDERNVRVLAEVPFKNAFGMFSPLIAAVRNGDPVIGFFDGL